MYVCTYNMYVHVYECTYNMYIHVYVCMYEQYVHTCVWMYVQYVHKFVHKWVMNATCRSYLPHGSLVRAVIPLLQEHLLDTTRLLHFVSHVWVCICLVSHDNSNACGRALSAAPVSACTSVISILHIWQQAEFAIPHIPLVWGVVYSRCTYDSLFPIVFPGEEYCLLWNRPKPRASLHSYIPYQDVMRCGLFLVSLPAEQWSSHPRPTPLGMCGLGANATDLVGHSKW